MTTLITVSGHGWSRRCDEKCYNATGPDCDCCCNGVNHGVGLKQAQNNTNEIGLKMIADYEKRTGQKVEKVLISPEQLDLIDLLLD